MSFFRILGVRPGITSLIGSGGKTTLMERLAAELTPRGSVLLCTSTKIYPPKEIYTLLDPAAVAVADALATFGVVCVGSPGEGGKLSAPKLNFSDLCKLADYVLVEADGAHRLPLKAHADYEPVIAAESGRSICVMGLSGLGLPIAQVAHRPALYARLAGVGVETLATPTLAARVLRRENLADCYYLNQAEGEHRQTLAQTLATQVDKPVFYGSLQEDWIC